MTWQEELVAIQTSSPDGLLHPDAVVARAAEPESALHAWFEWDDTEAARLFRLEQARRVIRAHVVVLRPDTPEVHAWVSLSNDRYASGGYRPATFVMNDQDLRSQLLETAFNELAAFKEKYSVLSELAGVFAAIDEVRAKVAEREFVTVVDVGSD